MACSLSLVPLQHRSLAGREHGRTIPLPEVILRRAYRQSSMTYAPGRQQPTAGGSLPRFLWRLGRLSKDGACRRVDQVHVIHIGAEPHRFARFSAATRIDATADLLTIDVEVHHCLHAHRLHDI